MSDVVNVQLFQDCIYNEAVLLTQSIQPFID